MADITNPEAIRFVNEFVRPVAERMRAMKAIDNSGLIDWYAGKNNLFPNDTSLVDDGRPVVDRSVSGDRNDSRRE